jgi:hypothetical protein
MSEDNSPENRGVWKMLYPSEKPSENMRHYWSKLWRESGTCAWAFVVENRVPAFICGALVPVLVVLFQYAAGLQTLKDMKTALIGAAWIAGVYIFLFAVVYIGFLIYGVPKRRLAGAIRRIEESEKRAQDLQDRLDDYDQTPVLPIIEMPSNSEPICVNILNKGRDSEPIESVCLYLHDGEINEAFRLILKIEDGKKLPLIMPGKTNLRIYFDLCGAHCIQWGVKSVFAFVTFQDRRQREGERATIRQSSALDGLLVAPAEHALERTWEQSMVRHKRIHAVAAAYRVARGITPRNQFAINMWRDLHEARIRDLEDATEVRELFAILDGNKVPNPFERGEDADEILRFYKAKPTKTSIGGIVEWIKAYNEWFGASLPIPE